MTPSHQAKLDAFRAGEPVAGLFWPAGDDERVRQGFARWRPDGGVIVELIEPPDDWPSAHRGPTFALHGELRDLGDVTLLWAWPKTWTGFEERPFRYFSSDLAFGAHTDPDELWHRAIYSTLSLSEWRRDTGLSFSHPNMRKRPYHFRVDVQPPAVDDVELPQATLRFGGRADYSVSYSPEWSVTTQQTLAVLPNRPLTVSRARRRYGDALAALSAFVAGQDDELTYEVYVNPDQKRRVEIWSGDQAGSREWLGQPRLIFHADELADFPRAIRRWWRTYEQSWPALGVFASQYEEGSRYWPTRLLTIVSAIESYGRSRHSTENLRELRRYGGVSSAVTGCTNDALTLAKVARGYFAHYKQLPPKYPPEVLHDSTVDSIRRLTALMQSCLLREMGFPKARREELLLAHYRSWPLT